jgi:Cu+-exporting ATPase
MDVLVAMGTSAAYFYSIFVLLGAVPGHGYFETSAVIITLVRLGKYLEAKAKGGASEANRKLLYLQPKKATVIRGA